MSPSFLLPSVHRQGTSSSHTTTTSTTKVYYYYCFGYDRHHCSRCGCGCCSSIDSRIIPTDMICFTSTITCTRTINSRISNRRSSYSYSSNITVIATATAGYYYYRYGYYCCDGGSSFDTSRIVVPIDTTYLNTITTKTSSNNSNSYSAFACCD